MSETGHASPEFTRQDIPTNASENNVQPQPAIMALADKLRHVNRAIIDFDHVESEERLIEIRHDWLIQADASLTAGDYGAAVSFMKNVIADIEHSADHTHLEEAKRLLEDCYAPAQPRHAARSALERTIHYPQAS